MPLDSSVGELAPGKIKKLKTVQCGVAGEYFVAAELSRRGYIASLNLKNTERIDILASRKDGSRQIGIQVASSKVMMPLG